MLDINKEKQEISLGMKQADGNPWDEVDKTFPAGTVVEGTVRNLMNYGAFIEISDGVDGLLHVSDMSWTKKIRSTNPMSLKTLTIPWTLNSKWKTTSLSRPAASPTSRCPASRSCRSQSP